MSWGVWAESPTGRGRTYVPEDPSRFHGGKDIVPVESAQLFPTEALAQAMASMLNEIMFDRAKTKTRGLWAIASHGWTVVRVEAPSRN